MNVDFVSNEEVVRAARRNLSQAAWDYLVTGASSETTLRRNRLSFDSLALRPRVLRDVAQIDPSVSLLGHKLRMPVILAPIGSMQHLSPDAGLGFARAAAEFGTVMSVSLMSPPSIEDVAAATEAPKVLQIYVQGDDAWLRTVLQRAEASGYAAICLTVDSPYHGRHDRQLLNPLPARRPAVHRDGPNYLASVTWDTLDRIRDMTPLPFMLKGVMTGEDATLAMEHGVDHVWVSNHGGRQLDGALAAIDVLPEVVAAVAGRAGVVFDGGVLRGTDVVKALALGADVVAIGRLQGWGMAAGGAPGLVRTLEILENELISAFGLLGVRCIDELNPSYVTHAEPVRPAHEMSAWVTLAEDRIV
jgi:isopentenyl diphosphate isomerase/L-lactate dehydrogenase-like FMN-dependent dehydrogenase